ncbi:glycoside hydrolase family 43 protein [Rufibacter sediminis]|uniref:Glycoside hydrolase family 43 protein n=1 Tax=Rufibacter sediminis TaxID=2762756 RepID=A0ABR6VZR6_9BACT|nr:glycoside hydrolase family 43 protein [Rufibacter sediminis]MBC3542198.1 glycoside hydrolase family 43 protein [Rufibacter sediminis]
MIKFRTAKYLPFVLIAASALNSACQKQSSTETESSEAKSETTAAAKDTSKYLSQPLIPGMYTADPSAHVFNGKIYIYPSHDIDAGTPENDNGDHFDMRDYHVFSMDDINGKVTDHGVALDVKDVAWAKRQMWAPDAAFKNGKYYLYFPAKDKQDIFRIGVATSTSPTGPFKAEAKPIDGAYSIDPAVYTDTDGTSYMYFGGIWGGQLQRWATGKYDSTAAPEPANGVALAPKMAKMRADMLGFDGPVKDVQILDENGKPFPATNHDKRFFEAAWVHKYNGKYYFSYSTGDTHNIAYAIGDSPAGPFTYKGVLLNPVEGWTNHHSVVEFKGKWYLFYHDVQNSGKTFLRNVKVTELTHNPDGTIQTITAVKS